MSESADEELASDTTTLIRGIIRDADFDMPEPDPEDMEEMNPQMQMLSQSMDVEQILGMVLPHLEYLVGENREEALRVLESIEENARELREYHE